MWESSSLFVANALWHKLHLYGFSPVWVLKWFFKVIMCANALWQSVHWYGFSPVWVRAWRVQLYSSMKRLYDINCTCMVFLQCGFLSGVWDNNFVQMFCNKIHIWIVFLHYGFLLASLNLQQSDMTIMKLVLSCLSTLLLDLLELKWVDIKFWFDFVIEYNMQMRKLAMGFVNF